MAKATTTKDPRIGKPLTETVRYHALRGALLTAHPSLIIVDESTLAELVNRAFGNIRVTAISYSHKRRSYQIATKGPKGSLTMHLKDAEVIS